MNQMSTMQPLIRGLPNEIALTILGNLDNRNDQYNLRLTSRALNIHFQPRVWAHLDLVSTAGMVKKLKALLVQPQVRHMVKTIRWPSFQEERGGSARKHWDSQLDKL
jgi:hypothetical protein